MPVKHAINSVEGHGASLDERNERYWTNSPLEKRLMATFLAVS